MRFPELPSALQADVKAAWAAILGAAASETRDLLQQFAGSTEGAEAQRVAELTKVLACSRYAAESFRRRPDSLLELLAPGVLERAPTPSELQEELAAHLLAADDPAPILRRFRRHHILRVIWRDLNRRADTLETMTTVSALADTCITSALRIAMEDLTAKFGTPIGASSGTAQELIVLAMGKLGGRELNLSSDVDLIFLYPEAGATEGGRRSLSNEEFFTRVGRALIALLDARTAEGFVFRVDMRLRPYGESGALVHSYGALEAYLQDQGRDWERYAMIKARPINGDQATLAPLVACLKPFIYRRYVDYSAIDSLRSMKRMIVAEVRRRGLEGNVKLGSGGIREVEFIAQCFQLIRGGRDRSLQQRELLPTLDECATLGCLPKDHVQELRDAYLFLRDVEHAIQAWEDRQTQELPTDDNQRLALAYAMNFPDWDAFAAALAKHRYRVAMHFAELIEDPDAPAPEPAAASLWRSNCDPAELAKIGYQEAEASARRISDLFGSRRVQALQAEGRERLDRFVPMLLQACAEVANPDVALERALPLVAAVARRSAYLLLFLENPPALADLASLCSASPWIAEQLTQHPALLDELLDRASLYSAPDRDELFTDLRQQTARLTTDDLEGFMLALRYFKASQVLRVAASELAGRLPIMQVSDKLSFLAEVCLEQVVALAWEQLTARYGEPARESDSMAFTVVAYGKLGGIELSYASDLDLVFLYDAPSGGYTDGARSIDNATFYTRMGQRIIHILEARMTFGQLYEVDMRLRPSGASGLLVSSFSAFDHYEAADAWTWEHQALVRARAVAGDSALRSRFEELRRRILCRERDDRFVQHEVVEMRKTMRKHAGLGDQGANFDLKQGVGGIVDIEFMVQYAVLAWAHREPELAEWSDNARILATLARTGLLAAERCRALNDAYLALRSATHQLALQQQSRTVPAERFRVHRHAVREAWSTLFGSDG